MWNAAVYMKQWVLWKELMGVYRRDLLHLCREQEVFAGVQLDDGSVMSAKRDIGSGYCMSFSCKRFLSSAATQDLHIYDRPGTPSKHGESAHLWPHPPHWQVFFEGKCVIPLVPVKAEEACSV